MQIPHSRATDNAGAILEAAAVVTGGPLLVEGLLFRSYSEILEAIAGGAAIRLPAEVTDLQNSEKSVLCGTSLGLVYRDYR